MERIRTHESIGHPLWTPVHQQTLDGAIHLEKEGLLSQKRVRGVKHLLSLEYDSQQDKWIDMANPNSDEAKKYDRLMHKELSLLTRIIVSNQNQKGSAEATQALNTGNIENANKIFRLFDTSPQNVQPEIEVIVIDQPEKWWMEKLQTTAISLPLPNKLGKRVIVVNPKLDDLDHELTHALLEPKGFPVGKDHIIGSELQECMIDFLRDKPMNFRRYMNVPLQKISAENGVPETKRVIVEALQGNPIKWFTAIESMFGNNGLAMMLMIDPTSDYPDLVDIGKFNEVLKPFN